MGPSEIFVVGNAEPAGFGLNRSRVRSPQLNWSNRRFARAESAFCPFVGCTCAHREAPTRGRIVGRPSFLNGFS